jgi:hypothetical protein
VRRLHSPGIPGGLGGGVLNYFNSYPSMHPHHRTSCTCRVLSAPLALNLLPLHRERCTLHPGEAQKSHTPYSCLKRRELCQTVRGAMHRLRARNAVRKNRYFTRFSHRARLAARVAGGGAQRSLLYARAAALRDRSQGRPKRGPWARRGGLGSQLKPCAMGCYYRTARTVRVRSQQAGGIS